MQMELAKTLRNYDRKNLSKDVLTGLIIMAVSIPISMGYAQIAGLPAVYGLYGSVFPIILFWAVFHITPVHLRGGCSTSGVSRGGTGGNGNPEWFETGRGGCAGTHIFCGSLAVCICIFKSRKTGKLYFRTCNGRLYHRYLYHNYSHAGAQLMGGTAGTGELPELAEHIWATLGRSICLP